MTGRRLFAVALLVCAAVGVGLAAVASPFPDGLERVAIDLGFADRAEAPGIAGPFEGYEIAAIADPFLSGAAAATIGLVIVLLLSSGLAALLRGARRSG